MFKTCVSANRFIIQDDIFDTFVKKLQDKMTAFKIGNGMEPKTTLGPLINKAQVNKVCIYKIFCLCPLKQSDSLMHFT